MPLDDHMNTALVQKLSSQHGAGIQITELGNVPQQLLSYNAWFVRRQRFIQREIGDANSPRIQRMSVLCAAIANVLTVECRQ